MQTYSTPIRHCPATVLLLDDSAVWVNNLAQEISVKAPCVSFQDPRKALSFLNGLSAETFLDRCTTTKTSPYSQQDTHQFLDPYKIHKEALNKDRFADIGIMLVDYAMPGMDGLSFCKQVKDKHIKTILLTAEADESIAVNAFNAGLIDGYVKKSEPELLATLFERIAALEQQRALALSERVISVLANKEDEPISTCMLDTDFAPFFQTILADNNIVEYYFVSAPANFLMLDFTGKAMWLCIRDESEMSSMVDWAQDQCEESGGECPSIDAFKQKAQMTFFYSDDDQNLAYEKWGPCVHPCKAITTSSGTRYYYSLIRDDTHYGVGSEVQGLETYIEAAFLATQKS